MGKKKNVLTAGNFLIPVSASQNVSSASNQAIQHGVAMNAAISSSQSQFGGVDPLSQAILTLNANPYLIGIFMLVLNLGGRFLTLELTKKQEAFLQQPWLRPLVFFTVIFIATRNLAVAFWVSLFFFFIIWVAANENSPFCMIPSWCGHNLEEDKVKYENNIKKI